ncbi:MAG: AN1-type zinc finger domain-containing protein [Promethearchaeota archaeon]
MPENTCDFCGEQSFMLFKCKYCGKSFCAQHRLPEKHACPSAQDIQNNQQNLTNNYYSSPTSENYRQFDDAPSEYVWAPDITEIDGDPFDPSSGFVIKGIFLPRLNEFIHIIIAFLIMFFLGFISGRTLSAGMIFNPASGINFTPNERELFPFLFALLFTVSFLVHEFSHRQVGRHYKLPAKFRLLTFGMLITIIGIIGYLTAGIPPFALPGAVVVIGLENEEHAGRCKWAGPLSNLIISAIIIPFIFIIPYTEFEYSVLLIYGLQINSFLGLFNCMPVGLLDGAMIIKWRKSIWLITVLLLAACLILSFTLLFNLSSLFQLLRSF